MTSAGTEVIALLQLGVHSFEPLSYEPLCCTVVVHYLDIRVFCYAGNSLSRFGSAANPMRRVRSFVRPSRVGGRRLSREYMGYTHVKSYRWCGCRHNWACHRLSRVLVFCACEAFVVGGKSLGGLNWV